MEGLDSLKQLEIIDLAENQVLGAYSSTYHSHAKNKLLLLLKCLDTYSTNSSVASTSKLA